MTAPTDDNLKRARELYKTKARRNFLGEPIRPVTLAPSPEMIAKALSDAEQRGREAGIREAADGLTKRSAVLRQYRHADHYAYVNAAADILALLEGGDDAAK